jgi:hypothetical protein
MRVRDVEAVGDYRLIVQQISVESHCLDGVLNSYHDKCIDIVRVLDTFNISHIPREEKCKSQLSG